MIVVITSRSYIHELLCMLCEVRYIGYIHMNSCHLALSPNACSMELASCTAVTHWHSWPLWHLGL